MKKGMRILATAFAAVAVSGGFAGEREFKTRTFEGKFKSARYYAVSSLSDGSDAEVAFIVVHGWGAGGRKSSDAEIFDAEARKRLKDGERAPYVLAPLFPMRASLKRTKTAADGLSVWNDSWGRDLSRPGKADDDWRGGGDASNGTISSFEVIDHVFACLGDKTRFPNLRRVVLAGFSAGGQFVARYAAVGKGAVRDGVEVAYIAMSPSTWLRLDDDVPWHYGLKDRPRYAKDLTKAKILANLSSRDVLYACGGADTGKSALDRTPSAMLQGANRLERFYSFKKHVETFPGWRARALFAVIPGLKHNGRGVYNRPDYFGFIMRGETGPFAAAAAAEMPAATDWTRTPGHITVEWKDGKAVWSIGGYADIDAKKPMEKDALFWAASNTKGIAAALVLTFVDEGKIDLDAPVENYFPQWRDIKVVEKAKDGTETRRAPKTKPTVRHVLSHMSGLAFFPKMPIDQYSMQELVDIAVEKGLAADPGAKYRYSNWGIDIAVAITEKVGGKPWETLLQERVLDPLGMKGATFWPTLEEQKRIVVPYHFPKGGGKPVRGNGVNQFSPAVENRETRHAEAGGGLYFTADDAARFFYMVANRGVGLNGKRVLSESICREWYRRQTPSHVKASYSFGMVVDHAKGMIEHGGAYATHGVADWRSRTFKVRLVQKCGLPRTPPRVVR